MLSYHCCCSDVVRIFEPVAGSVERSALAIVRPSLILKASRDICECYVGALRAFGRRFGSVNALRVKRKPVPDDRDAAGDRSTDD